MSDASPAAPRMPAEWEPHERVWISWPLNPETWPGRLPRLQQRFAELTALLSRYVPVAINAAKGAHDAVRAALAAAAVDRQQVALFDHPTNDVWCRDHGPIFVQTANGQPAVTDWRFNAWGGKFPPWNLDDAVPQRVAESLALPRFASSLVLEGGAIETDGAGLFLSTEAVLLNANRNPEWTRAQIEAELARLLGARQVCWFPHGIEGDDTDGHVDDFCRFIGPQRLVAAVESNPADPNYRVLCENRERLDDLRTEDGGRFEMIELPMPAPLAATDWRLERLPASYANFLITNHAVIAPVFNQPQLDRQALGILGEVFPERDVIGFDARDFVYEGGAIHCLTQQQPAVIR
ncbi:MAG: agmatine deiminase family protein [Planctomycetales bacterium]|nr:agmatine deiminase family protein [Planctomycetales bacterium]